MSVAAWPMQAPFPYAGGKSRIAPIFWQAFGDPPNFVDPFGGSLAPLLGRPAAADGRRRTETVSDADGLLVNAYRGIRSDPEAVAHWSDWPVSEADLHARHAWLVARKGDLAERLMGDPCYFEAQAAGWWVWGACAWIGSGWCSGRGPWQVIDGRLVDTRQLPHAGDAGRGINRKLPHAGDAGRGINRKQFILAWFEALAERLRDVRILCGDWGRALTPSLTTRHGLTAVLLDPPYTDVEHAWDYAAGGGVAADARAWAAAHGDDPMFRIALCNYDDGWRPDGWTIYRWKARGGYGSQGRGRGRINCARETIWLSPHCLPVEPPA
ncbi:MAG TPA: hypothetical protein PKD53_00460 [Chloroflexaceae bacterium]|mgnify:CR=1 FL=1|nr:hypothetical protein [Chloroflexaceae bacterium]